MLPGIKPSFEQLSVHVIPPPIWALFFEKTDLDLLLLSFELIKIDIFLPETHFFDSQCLKDIL